MAEGPSKAHKKLADRAVEAMEYLKYNRLVICTPVVQRRAVILLSITGRTDVVLHWVRLQQVQEWKRRPGLAVLYGAAAVAQWVQTWSTHPDVLRVAQDPLDSTRQRLLLFAAEFETHVEVHRLHRRGLRVPSSHVVATYLSALGKHRLSDATTAHAQRIERRAVTAKKWGRAFRQRWGHLWGTGGSTHGVNDMDVNRRGGIFFRWLGHVLAELRNHGDPIVVNMDETMLSSVKPRKLGVVPNIQRARQIPLGNVPKERALPRTSLTAAVCSDAALQRHLPQMRLPRAYGGAVAGLRARAAYATAGQPQMTVHGTGGWNTGEILCLWLRELKQRLQRAAPGRPLLLVMDDCTVHVSDVVLQKCRSLGIAVVIVPARCTWLLQPLDTHVFAKLKNEIRQRCFAAVARSASGHMTPCERIRLQGAAIRRILVEQDWSRVMQRSGLAGPAHELRTAVQSFVRDGDAQARFPSEADLLEVLHMSAVRIGRVREALLATVEAAAGDAAAQGGPILPAPSAVAPVADVVSRVRPVPSLMLSARARLPAALPRRDLAPAFLFSRERRSPVMTRSRSATALDEGDAAAAPAAPAAAPASRRRRS